MTTPNIATFAMPSTFPAVVNASGVTAGSKVIRAVDIANAGDVTSNLAPFAPQGGELVVLNGGGTNPGDTILVLLADPDVVSGPVL